METRTTIPSLLRNLLVLMELDPDGVRARLKQARKKAGITQEQASETLRVHKGTVENDEGRGEAANATFSRLNEYARLYNRPVEWFLWGDEVIVHEAASAERLEALAERLEAFVGRLESLENGRAEPRRGRARR